MDPIEELTKCPQCGRGLLMRSPVTDTLDNDDTHVFFGDTTDYGAVYRIECDSTPETCGWSLGSPDPEPVSKGSLQQILAEVHLREVMSA